MSPSQEEEAHEVLEGYELGEMVETEQDATITYGISPIPILIEEENDDGTDTFEISAERLEALSLLAEAGDGGGGGGNGEGDRKLLDALSTEERKLFFKSVADGSLSGLVKPWNPWWNFPLPKVVLVIPGQVVVGDSKVGGDDAPDLAHDRGTLCCGQVISAFDRSFLPNETSISTRKPSPLLRFNVVDVLLAYVKVRLFYT